MYVFSPISLGAFTVELIGLVRGHSDSLVSVDFVWRKSCLDFFKERSCQSYFCKPELKNVTSMGLFFYFAAIIMTMNAAVTQANYRVILR